MRNNQRPISFGVNSPYRKSLSTLTSDFTRISFAPETSLPSYRESLGTMPRFRTSVDVGSSDRFYKEFDTDHSKRERSSLSNIKSTLSQLEKKINKAKKQLNTYKNIISEDEEEQEEQDKVEWDQKPRLFYEATTVGSSLSKFIPHNFSQNQRTHRPKGYYLSQLASALQGSNQRALDHLNISHKILKNAHKLDSPTFADIEERKVNIMRKNCDLGKKTLLIDIDQTILHCEEDGNKPYDIKVPVEVENGGTAQAYVSIRPYAISFLKRMGKHFEIIGFTASHESYADVVLDQIDPDREYIRHRLYRRHCIQIHDNIFAKDLRIVNRDLSQMVLVDNAPYSYIFQLQNGIPVLPYYSGEDNELVQLQKYLQELVKCGDVREFNKKRFKFHQYCNYEELDQLVKDLYFTQNN